ncbi:hypothetical protein MRB53_039095 [Persea americana]|nr:hypothetical protein MRB53_039095 [Persea americana]
MSDSCSHAPEPRSLCVQSRRFLFHGDHDAAIFISLIQHPAEPSSSSCSNRRGAYCDRPVAASPPSESSLVGAAGRRRRSPADSRASCIRCTYSRQGSAAPLSQNIPPSASLGICRCPGAFIWIIQGARRVSSSLRRPSRSNRRLIHHHHHHHAVQHPAHPQAGDQEAACSGWATPSWPAPVSNAGGLGIITALTQPTPDDLRKEIRKCKAMTANPFAVNLTLLPSMNPPDYPAYAQAIVDEGIRIVETAGNSPGPIITLLKAAGCVILHKCTTIRHAKSAVKLGVDFLSIDGFECAGPRRRDGHCEPGAAEPRPPGYPHPLYRVRRLLRRLRARGGAEPRRRGHQHGHALHVHGRGPDPPQHQGCHRGRRRDGTRSCCSAAGATPRGCSRTRSPSRPTRSRAPAPPASLRRSALG